jgi:hypothetical protein
MGLLYLSYLLSLRSSSSLPLPYFSTLFHKRFSGKMSLNNVCLKEFSSIKFNENHSSGNLVIHADRRTCRQAGRQTERQTDTDMTKLHSHFSQILTSDCAVEFCGQELRRKTHGFPQTNRRH